MRFPEAYRFLSSRKRFGGGRGLDAMRHSLAAIGDPHLAFPSIHVAGTNGKGSVAAILEALLGASDRRVGLYTSPHLLRITERVRIDGEEVDEEAFAEAVGALADVILRDDLTYFEAVTLVAFHLFRERSIEVGVVEVGLGGRLDATNFVRPVVAVVTNIERDHTAVLGRELPQIAREKLGVAKPGVPLLTGVEQEPLLPTFRRAAERAGAPLHLLDDEVSIRVAGISAAGVTFDLSTPEISIRGLRLPLTGRHQARNAALAIRALEIVDPPLRPPETRLRRALDRVRLPGRFEIRRVAAGTTVLDVFHNRQGAAAVRDTIEALFGEAPVRLVIGMAGDKEMGETARVLAPLVTEVFAVRPDFGSQDRDVGAGDVASCFRAEGVPVIDALPTGDAFERAVSRTGRGEILLVGGSFRTVAEFVARRPAG